MSVSNLNKGLSGRRRQSFSTVQSRYNPKEHFDQLNKVGQKAVCQRAKGCIKCLHNKGFDLTASSNGSEHPGQTRVRVKCVAQSVQADYSKPVQVANYFDCQRYKRNQEKKRKAKLASRSVMT
jgi:hypothetical protein